MTSWKGRQFDCSFPAGRGTKSSGRENYRQIRPVVPESELVVMDQRVDKTKQLQWGVRSNGWTGRCDRHVQRMDEQRQKRSEMASRKAAEAIDKQRSREGRLNQNIAEKKKANHDNFSQIAKQAREKNQANADHVFERETGAIREAVRTQREHEQQVAAQIQRAADMEEDGWLLDDETQDQAFNREVTGVQELIGN
eukprot:TRINITY_DN20994_c0_g2_i3.p1 TRINITY_DN20994_c0_g2~~TRINITY_DN20994_c0_g2_i3.p1  ORF type:complete len:196 (+),score=52.22 TRINITY_DN20994_c0_g2_i3:161-748(+)